MAGTRAGASTDNKCIGLSCNLFTKESFQNRYEMLNQLLRSSALPEIKNPSGPSLPAANTAEALSTTLRTALQGGEMPGDGIWHFAFGNSLPCALLALKFISTMPGQSASRAAARGETKDNSKYTSLSRKGSGLILLAVYCVINFLIS